MAVVRVGVNMVMVCIVRVVLVNVVLVLVCMVLMSIDVGMDVTIMLTGTAVGVMVVVISGGVNIW